MIRPLDGRGAGREICMAAVIDCIKEGRFLKNVIKAMEFSASVGLCERAPGRRSGYDGRINPFSAPAQKDEWQLFWGDFMFLIKITGAIKEVLYIRNRQVSSRGWWSVGVLPALPLSHPSWHRSNLSPLQPQDASFQLRSGCAITQKGLI